MAARGSTGVDVVVAQWRRGFYNDHGQLDGIRPDDLEELCDHFRNALTDRLDVGDTMEAAAAVASRQVGSPVSLSAEMARERHPPRYYQNWCLVLAWYGILHTTMIICRLAALGASAYRTGVPAPQGADPYQITTISVVCGVLLTAILVPRFALRRPTPGLTKYRSLIFSGGLIATLTVFLFFGLVFSDYWEWWLRPATTSQPWDASMLWAIMIGLGGPPLALSAVTGLRHWHPALRPTPSTNPKSPTHP